MKESFSSHSTDHANNDEMQCVVCGKLESSLHQETEDIWVRIAVHQRVGICLECSDKVDWWDLNKQDIEEYGTYASCFGKTKEFKKFRSLKDNNSSEGA